MKKFLNSNDNIELESLHSGVNKDDDSEEILLGDHPSSSNHHSTKQFINPLQICKYQGGNDSDYDDDDSKQPVLQNAILCIKDSFQNYKPKDWINLFVPCTKWLTTYNWRTLFLADLMAGLTVGIMIIPQSMSYAGIAGLPPHYGLYGAFVPVLVYVVFGNSRQLSVGPISITSMLVQQGITKILTQKTDQNQEQGANTDLNHILNIQIDMDEYISKAVQLAFLVGLIHVLMGVFRSGFLVNFISHPVVSGYTSAAVLIIAFSQVKYIVGYHVERSSYLFVTFKSLFTNISKLKWVDFFMGIAWIITLQICKYLGKKSPKLWFLKPAGPLMVSIVSTLVVANSQLQKEGVQIVGDIPKGLPPLSISVWFKIKDWYEMVKIALTVTLVGLMESISIAKSLAVKNKYELNANQELVGLGIANIVGSAFNCYPTFGAFSRTAVAENAGAKSGVAAFVSALLVGIVLLFLTPALYYLPMNALAAIVISGVIGLVNIGEMIKLYKSSMIDWVQWMVAFWATAILGADLGLGIAIVLVIFIVINETFQLNSEIVGKVPETTVCENIKYHPEVQLIPNTLIVRISNPIYFANVRSFRQLVLDYCYKAEQLLSQEDQVKVLVLDMSNVFRMDTFGVQALCDLASEFYQHDMALFMCYPNVHVRSLFKKAQKKGFVDQDFMKRHFFENICDVCDDAL